MFWISALSLSGFLVCWIYSRHRRESASITDIFVLAFLAIFTPFFLFNPSAVTRFNVPPFSDAIATRCSLGFCVFLLAGCGVFIARRYVGKASTQTFDDISNKALMRGAVLALALCIAIFIGLTALPSEFLIFKARSIRWIIGDLNPTEYAVFRRVYSGPILDGLVGRLRFSLFPVALLLVLTPLLLARSFARPALIAAFFFVALPLSLSKLPVVYYLGYLFIFVVMIRMETISLTRAGLFTLVGLASAMLVLSALYLVQYRAVNGYTSIFDEPIKLAVDRIWGESYSVPLRYFAAYPDKLAFSGWGGIGLSANLLGLQFRNPDLEVTAAILGPDSGSNPGIFFLAGYAAFGTLGIAIFSTLGFLLLWGIDAFTCLLRTRVCYMIYFSVMALNTLFLLQISLPTTLLSYGLAIIPPLVLAADRALLHFHRTASDQQS